MPSKIQERIFFSFFLNRYRFDNGQENTLSTKKVRLKKNDNVKEKEGRKWKTQIRNKHIASFFRYIQFRRIDK